MTGKISTRNVTRVFRLATEAQIAAGLDWYTDAHSVAQTMATAHGVSVAQAAGIIAALSPLNSWGANVNLANRLIASGGLTSGYLGVGLHKANAILAGTDPLVVLTSSKVRAFYLGILTQGETDAVCIDRHAYDVASGTRHNDQTRPTVSGKRYADAAEAYKRAARILSRETGETLSAAQVQAITWKAWRERYWAAGAWDAHTVA